MKPIIVTVKKTVCDHVVTYVCFDVEQAVDWANTYIQDYARDVGFGGVNWADKMFRLTGAPSPTGPFWFTKCGPLTVQINQNPLMRPHTGIDASFYQKTNDETSTAGH